MGIIIEIIRTSPIHKSYNDNLGMDYNCYYLFRRSRIQSKNRISREV
jgi:hypothetical protein